MTVGHIKIIYLPSFIKGLRKLESSLQEEAVRKSRLFVNRANHRQLDVHKLHGKLQDRYGFSVDHKYRIVFRWEGKSIAVFLAIGDHDVYR